MVTTVARNVNDIQADQKRALEGMLGGPLTADQQIVIFAYTPGAAPNEQQRSDARQRLERTLLASQAHAQEQGVDAAEADEAVAEAMQHVRRRS